MVVSDLISFKAYTTYKMCIDISIIYLLSISIPRSTRSTLTLPITKRLTTYIELNCKNFHFVSFRRIIWRGRGEEVSEKVILLDEVSYGG